VDRALGLLLLSVYIIAIVGLAALVTYVVIKLFPTQRTSKKPPEPGADDNPRPNGGSGGGSAGGRLYRRAKRGTA
jgi:hypothetical protein